MHHLFRIFAAFSIAWTAYSHQFPVDGTVLELDDSNFDSALAAFDFVFVDFYAPWCGHCKRISPELDAAARALYDSEPIVFAKVNADKYTSLARKFEIDGFPTLKLFIRGVPVDYQGPRKAELLVRYLKKFVAPDVAVLESDTVILNFIEDAGTYFPIFIVFGYNETLIWNLAIKHKKKAWFSVAKDFSENMMDLYDFSKVPALVSVYPGYDERSVFYGPFEEEQFVEEFIKQNLLPLVLRINHESLASLKNDDRKILLCIVEDETNEKAAEIIKLLKAAASANRDLVFGYVGVKQWAEFAETFEASTKLRLPKMVVWDGNEEYISANVSGRTGEEDPGNEISKFLEAYREGRTVKKKIKGPSFIGFINSLIGIRTVYLLVFVVGVVMLIQTIGKEEPPLRMDAPCGQVDKARTSVSRSEYESVDKED